MRVQRLLFGTDEAVAPARELRAGRLAAALRGTRLGPITFDGHEVWHGIDFLHRDADWGTPQPVVDRVEQHPARAGLHLTLHGRITAMAEIAFRITIRMGGQELAYEVAATVGDELATNRTGLVLMHPLAACGRRVEIEHTDGRTSASTFPTLVAPWPPFTLVRAVRHQYADGSWASCRFSGDDFELEDQRNNADASFKTYSRSNLMPRPYRLRAGMVLQQSVDLRVETAPLAPAPTVAGQVRVTLGADTRALPAIGTALAAAELRADARLQQLLRDLQPAHLHLGVDCSRETVDATALAGLLAACGCALRLDIEGVAADQAQAQLGRIAATLRAAGIRPAAVAVFASTPPVLEAARGSFPGCTVGGGTPHFFTQLNRIEDLGRVDFLAFTTASVVHGAADEEIMAGLQSLPAMVETLRDRHGPVPVQVGPSSIGARRSPLGGQPAADGSRRLALARRDPRTRGLYGAAWAVGYVAQLAHAGVQTVTLFELAGDAALTWPGGTTPAFEVLRRLGHPARCRSVALSRPAPLAVLALERPGGALTLLANLGEEPLQVVLDAANLPAVATVMDADALQRHVGGAAAQPWRQVALEGGGLRLESYAVACV